MEILLDSKVKNSTNTKTSPLPRKKRSHQASETDDDCCADDASNESKAKVSRVLEDHSYGKSKELPIDWTMLPLPCLENVYTYLGRSDQCSMSLTCQSWNEGFSSPSIWRKIQFRIPIPEYNGDICPAVKFARKYGAMFRHLEIFCKDGRLDSRLVDATIKQLRLFLDSIDWKAELHSMRFVGFNFETHPLQLPLLLFLRSQSKLKCVEFFNCEYLFLNFFIVIRCLFENEHRRTLDMLVLCIGMDQAVSLRLLWPGHRISLGDMKALANNSHFLAVDLRFSSHAEVQAVMLHNRFTGINHSWMMKWLLRSRMSEGLQTLRIVTGAMKEDTFLLRHFLEVCPKLRVLQFVGFFREDLLEALKWVLQKRPPALRTLYCEFDFDPIETIFKIVPVHPYISLLRELGIELIMKPIRSPIFSALHLSPLI